MIVTVIQLTMNLKFRIVDLLWIAVLASVLLGWFMDHKRLNSQSDIRDDAARRVLKNRRFAVTFSRYENEEDEALVKRSVQEILDMQLHGDETAQDFLTLITLFNLRNSSHDVLLTQACARATMDDLGCDSIDDLKTLFSRRQLDFRFVIDDHAEGHVEFSRFIENAMSRRGR